MDFSSKQILIAQDNMANQFVIRQLLKKVNIAQVFPQKVPAVTAQENIAGK